MTLSTDQLAELVTQKHACLTALRDLARRQRELVEEEELSQLFKLLSTKQQLLTLLQTVEQKLVPFRAEHPEHRKWSSPAARTGTARLAAECPALLKEILEQEADSERRLRARRDLTESQINSARSAGVARQAYAVQEHSAHRKLDLTAD